MTKLKYLSGLSLSAALLFAAPAMAGTSHTDMQKSQTAKGEIVHSMTLDANAKRQKVKSKHDCKDKSWSKVKAKSDVKSGAAKTQAASLPTACPEGTNAQADGSCMIMTSSPES